MHWEPAWSLFRSLQVALGLGIQTQLSVPVLGALHRSAMAQARTCHSFFPAVFLRLMDACFPLLYATWNLTAVKKVECVTLFLHDSSGFLRYLSNHIFNVHYFVNLSGDKHSLLVMLLMYYSFRLEVYCKISYSVFFSKTKVWKHVKISIRFQIFIATKFAFNRFDNQYLMKKILALEKILFSELWYIIHSIRWLPASKPCLQSLLVYMIFLYYHTPF